LARRREHGIEIPPDRVAKQGLEFLLPGCIDHHAAQCLIEERDGRRNLFDPWRSFSGQG
jgi:hypothetical protein